MFLPALLVYDFDGVMTDNRVLVMEDGTEAVFANRSDGWGVEMLRAAGFRQVILSTEANPVVSVRARKLRVDVIQGSKDKARDLTTFCELNNLALGSVLYVGNDVNDLPAIALVGFVVAPADAHPAILAKAQLVTHAKGGEGVIKELAEWLLQAEHRRQD